MIGPSHNPCYYKISGMLKNLYAVCKQLGDVQYSSPCCGGLTLSAGGQPGWIILRGF